MDEKLQEMSNGGYVKYSNKELIGGLHKKLDAINTRLANGDKKMTKMETNLKWHFMAISTLYTVLAVGILFIIESTRTFIQKIFGGA